MGLSHARRHSAIGGLDPDRPDGRRFPRPIAPKVEALQFGSDQFVANLAKSGLVAASALERAQSQLPDGPSSDAAVRLARLLIKQGTLTTYQARKVLGGATKGFFLGEYRILRSLGEGGMGKVYLAANQKDGLRVANKVLPPSKAADGGQGALRFRREMELLEEAQSPESGQDS